MVKRYSVRNGFESTFLSIPDDTPTKDKLETSVNILLKEVVGGPVQSGRHSIVSKHIQVSTIFWLQWKDRVDGSTKPVMELV